MVGFGAHRSRHFCWQGADPERWDRSWTAETTWAATDQQIFDYACLEGNYALPDILKGARKSEADSAKQ
jgi:hypothetical protein